MDVVVEGRLDESGHLRGDKVLTRVPANTRPEAKMAATDWSSDIRGGTSPMMMMGQICLLAAFVAVGYAAFACVLGARWERRTLLRTGLASAVGGMFALTVVMAVLVWALLVKDFSFNYVAQYSSRLLPWHYSLSALWVGQAGSLLLWTWMLGLLALVFRFWPWKQRERTS